MGVSIEAHGAVRLIRVASPPHGILGARGAKELAAAVEEVLGDSAVRALIIAGADCGVFIRHYDLAAIRKAADAIRSGAIDAEAFVDADFGRMTDRIATSPVPVIAAINGICMGGGFEVALACDIRIAQRDVDHIGLPEIRVDILPGGGGTIRLARLVGEGPALDIALRGRTVDAQRAYDLGIVGDLADDAIAAALDIAQALAERDPRALGEIKRLVRSAHEGPVQHRLGDERIAFGRHLAASDTALASMDAALASGTMLEAVSACEPNDSAHKTMGDDR
ncbi:enoyl-CoA hydratase [Sphingopyxis sp. YR583]|uniref:enoyl-CoA hydratase/isomerase family protein n=1 Tax=Sphingopyxis sp. YR583 TaxID=1881047 RepID=UPI0008A73441|nr:enoyl-CoA hydratase/isomerase family protein [Sphingopyxis sp. YR583]SEH19242.1 enoyl-CoA hydratase [Sphingopyxis sp. YR583]